MKTFEQITQQALVEGTFKLPNRQTIAAFALGLGLSVEFCLYINIWGHGSEPNPAYSEKMRVILHNVKANPELRDRLLNQSLSPSDLTQMSSDEMASRELQAEKAQIIKETEKQHILLPEAAPKFRKTHKGEELIEDSTNHFVNTESAPQLSTRIHEKGTKEESPERMGSHSPTAFQPTSFKQNANPLTVDTQARRKSTTERKSSSGFDMNNVWSSVDSPSAARPMVTPNTPGIKGPGAKADPEIDQLLGNDEEEPYSPMDYTMEPGMIWRGNIVMPTVAEFQANAKYAAGANLEKQYPWADVIGRTLWIEGRIQGDVASEYVCNLRFSKTTDVSIISLTPSDNTRDHQNFTKLFEYFTTRQRWGVGKSPLGHTRDVYIIPLESGNAPKPEFLNLLEDSAVGENRPNRMLLVIYIIKLTAPTTGTPATPAQQTVASPAINQQASNGSVNITMPDVTSSVDTKSIATNGPVLAIEPSQDGTGKKGREAAEFILGPVLSNAATVNHILTQALDCGEQQFMHIRACYLEDPRTMTDWPLLLTALTLRAQTTDAEIADEEEKKKRLATVA